MNLKEWFEAINAEKIRAMVGEPENQNLDCKRIGAEKDLKSNLAKLISGFSNADGGVCFWGVDARKNSDGIDCIDSFPGVDSPVLMAARLNELSMQAVSPGVEGVVHVGIDEGDGRGFVVSYVPASSGGPHMARYGEDRYYQRIGSSFLRMEPFQIADMFGRRMRPDLKVEEVFTNENYGFKLKIINKGRGVAEAPYIQIWVDPPLRKNEYGADGNRGEHLPYIRHESDGSWIHAGNRDFVIHPGMSVLIGGIWAGFSGGVLHDQFAKFRYKVGAIGVEAVEEERWVKMY